MVSTIKKAVERSCTLTDARQCFFDIFEEVKAWEKESSTKELFHKKAIYGLGLRESATRLIFLVLATSLDEQKRLVQVENKRHYLQEIINLVKKNNSETSIIDAGHTVYQAAYATSLIDDASLTESLFLLNCEMFTMLNIATSLDKYLSELEIVELYSKGRQSIPFWIPTIKSQAMKTANDIFS